MSDPRTKAYTITALSSLFNTLDGYSNLDRMSLAQSLEQMNLLEQENRKGLDTFGEYAKWSFTISFLELLNAWQWFLAGIILSRQADLPAQTMQMYYYSIFFAYRAFLSVHFKGRYTLETKPEDKQVRRIRKDLWVDENDDAPVIVVQDIVRGGEHRITANWFYEVFKQWDLKDNHPTVSTFESDQGFHVELRHFYTYSLSEIADELYSSPGDGNHIPIPDDALKYFVARGAMGDIQWDEIYPEAVWAFEHIRVPLDVHVKLLKMYDKESPYAYTQVRLVHGLYAHYQTAGLADFIYTAMEPIYKHTGVRLD